ncbi:hypothetical protein SBRCBS47491_001887 [Sporothrix bragantina]|uniref:Uncharacterized protein n=1 Tax=Sporothrix bragantina TaxID=671064 RepID=A0ABP0B342_9PEZI
MANNGQLPALPPTRNDRGTNTRSRFIEPPMQEYTPAHSLYEEEMDGYHDENENDDYAAFEERRQRLRRALRGINAALHLIACALLVVIMALFLARARRPHNHRHGFRQRVPPAIALIILLAGDIVLDFLTVVRLVRVHLARTPTWPSHPTIAIVVRLALGLGYLTLFMVYVGMGNVFPRGYTFWGLTRALSGPVVYLFLWMLGVWDLLHTALHRHQVGGWRWRWWRGDEVQPGQPGASAPAVPLDTRPGRRPTAPGPGMVRSPVGGSTATTAAPPLVRGLSTVREAGEGEESSRPERGNNDKPMSSSVSSASTAASVSTQTTQTTQTKQAETT